MISASWPQDLGYSPATVASGCGEKLVFIESAGDPLSCEQVHYPAILRVAETEQ